MSSPAFEATENIDLPALERECLVMERDTWSNLAAAWERLGMPTAAADCRRRVVMLDKMLAKGELPHGA